MKKKIAIIVPFFSLGGAESQAFYLAQIYYNAGFDVTVLAFDRKSGLLIDNLNEKGIAHAYIPFKLETIHLRGFKKILGLLKVALFFRKLKFDYLFPFTYYPNVVCSAVWRLSGVKKCFWNQRGVEKLPLNVIEKIAIKMKPSYLGNAYVCADFISKRHELNSGVVKVIKNGIEKTSFVEDESFKSFQTLTKGKLVYIMVANFYPEKKHEFLLSAWQKATQNEPDKLLILVGYSPNQVFLLKAKALAYDLRIGNVHFMESSNNIPGLLKLSDVGVLMSESEGCPNSVLEYMLNKMPAIVSKIPATQEVFEGNYPLLCDLNDETQLVDCIRKCFDEGFRSEVGEQNYNRVSVNYNLDNLSQSYLSLVC